MVLEKYRQAIVAGGEYKTFKHLVAALGGGKGALKGACTWVVSAMDLHKKGKYVLGTTKPWVRINSTSTTSEVWHYPRLNRGRQGTGLKRGRQGTGLKRGRQGNEEDNDSSSCRTRKASMHMFTTHRPEGRGRDPGLGAGARDGPGPQAWGPGPEALRPWAQDPGPGPGPGA